jgi:AAA family ATP:ADP antiporter
MNMSSAIETKGPAPEFGKIRAALWPIHNYEMKKFLPMGLMMFFILFNYTVLRSTKDAIVIPAAGSAIVPFLKGMVVMPAAILFVILYSKLVNALKPATVFYIITGFFISFFALYAFVIFPNNAFFLPDPAYIKTLQGEYPRVQHIISIYAYWTDAVFYTLAELWGSIMLSLLFWQFANEITRTKEASRFYALFGLLGNFALILSGFVLRTASSSQMGAGGGAEAYTTTLQYTIGAVVLGGFIVIYLYNWMQRNVLTDPLYYDAVAEVKTGVAKPKKPKLSVGESFKYIFSSPYILFIALLVLAYGISMNLIELNWKEVVKQMYPERIDYQHFMGLLQYAMGGTTIVAILFFKGIVRRFGWYVGAITTPLMMLGTGAIFFSFVLFENFMSPLAAMIGVTSLVMAVAVGTIQNVLSKGTKYALFDPTKEMAYIPLDQELKTKGKAAVDVIGGRLGKAGGGYIVMAMFFVSGASDVLSITPYMAVAVCGVILLWILAVARLSGLYEAAVNKEEKREDKIDEKLGRKHI